MPRFIGRAARSESKQIEDNAFPRDMVKLNYSQQRLLPAEVIHYSLDTSDRGGKGIYAKRWYTWWATPAAVLECDASTPLMRAGARATQAAIARYEVEKIA